MRTLTNLGGTTLGLALLAGLATSANAQLVQTINYANFNDVTSIVRNGVAVQSAGLSGEQMTLSLTPPVAAAAGTAYFNTRQQVDLGFVTDFKFRIRDRSGSGSDGLSFIVQNSSVNAVGGGGGGIGFGTNLAFPTGNTGISNSLAIVFDVWDNSANWPTVPGANVITVQSSILGPGSANTPSSADSLGGVPVSGAFNDGAIHQVRIAYSPGTMQIYFDNLATPALTVPVNLANTLNLTTGTSSWVGFTAATGAPQNAERHEILDWQFSSMQVPSPAGAALLGLGGLAALRRRRTR
ncbi:MAG TPA: L-type lectin-domain containing protein [Phycisphaerales bacterium]|nr:L-type lectin-domain containing protein [Phycisphaerales bacterium]